MIIHTKILPPGIAGITLWPFVFIHPDYKGNKAMEQHERIHLRQQLEMLIVPFYLWYGIEYLVKLIKYRTHIDAYLSISFEQEAYNWQKWPDYLKTRKPYHWIRYV
jgi:hypothetical protein